MAKSLQDAETPASSERLFELALNTFAEDLEKEMPIELIELQEWLQNDLNNDCCSSLQLKPLEDMHDLLRPIASLKIVNGFTRLLRRLLEGQGSGSVLQILHLVEPTDVTKLCLVASTLLCPQLQDACEHLAMNKDLHSFLKDVGISDASQIKSGHQLLRMLLQTSNRWFELLVLGLIYAGQDSLVKQLVPGQDLCSQELDGVRLSECLNEPIDSPEFESADKWVTQRLKEVVEQQMVQLNCDTLKLERTDNPVTRLECKLPAGAKKLLEHQRELATPAISGQNSIVVAPTGSGKTLVAIRIVQSVIEANPQAKVAFLVPTSQLVEQQFKEFQENLPQELRNRVNFIHGSCDKQQRLPFVTALENYSVLVLSAQILLNQLTAGRDSDGLQGGVTRFRLIVFDECHHCKDNHAYNQIMKFYLKQKFHEQSNRLPQIVGLTASPGTGRAQTAEAALQHLERLCANMDCPAPVVVRRHQDSLLRVTANPDIRHHLVRKKGSDRFQGVIHEIMDEGERLVGQAYQQLSESDAAKMPQVQTRGTQGYVNYCKEIQNGMHKYEEIVSKRMHACSNYLEHCNYALIVCQMFMPDNALQYLKETLRSPDEMKRPPTCDFELQMRELLSDRISRLDALCQNNNEESPPLQELREILLEHFNANKHSNAIVFVKEKFFAKALAEFINSRVPDPAGRSPWAAVVTGATSSDRDGGTNAAQQKLRIEQFRKGNLGVLVSTSLTEEGLDIPTCNLVIRYGHITNEISMQQSRGRLRSKDSSYRVIVPENQESLLEKEQANESRHEMMLKAVDDLAALPNEKLQRRIRERQRTLLNEDAVEGPAAEAPQTSVECEILCKKCRILLTTSQRMRLIQDIHRVTLDNEFFTNKVKGSSSDSKKLGQQFEQVGIDLVCKRCGAMVGKVVRYRELFYPMVSVTGILVKQCNKTESERPLKKWKDAGEYLNIKDLTLDDRKSWLRKMPGLPRHLRQNLPN